MKEDNWTLDGKRITDDQVLLQLGVVLEEHSPLIVEHRHCRGARSPDRFIIDNLKELTDCFRAEAKPGDAFWIWIFEDTCPTERVAFHGKIPDSDGRVPKGGAY